MLRRGAHRGQSGAVAVEFALVLPILLVLLFGIIEFGLIMYDKALLTNASREAARAGIVLRSPKPTVAAIQAVATAYCSGLVTFGVANAPTIVVTQPWTSGSVLTVTMTYQYRTLVIGKLIELASGGTFGNPIQLNATAAMVNE
jgi:Flp pilus assembly protein TadG